MKGARGLFRLSLRSLTSAAAASLLGCGSTPQATAPDAEKTTSTRSQPSAAASVPPAEKKYQRTYIGVSATDIGGYTVSNVAGSGHGGYVMPTEVWEGYRGKQRDKLSQLEFYEAVGRPDLRAKAIRHGIITGSFAVVGAGLVVGGGIYIFSNWEGGDVPTLGWVLVGSGVACVLTAYVLGQFAINSWEAQKLANTHNQRLRLKLGLPPALPEPGEPDRQQIHHPTRFLGSLDEYKSLTLSYSF